MAWSPCTLTWSNSSWVCSLPGAGYWRGLLNAPSCLTTYWQGENPKNSHEVQQQGTPLRCSRGPEACEEECAAGCCKHRELEMETHGGSTGCETRPTQKGIPQLAGHEGRGNCWKGEGDPPSAGEPAEWGNLYLQGSCGVHHPFLCLPQHTGVIFLLGWCPLALAFIQHLLPEGICPSPISLCRLEYAWSLHKSFIRS